MIYSALFRFVLERLPAEKVHRATFQLLRAVTALPGVRRLLQHLLASCDPALTIQAMGLAFRSPLCLAAGFDKDGEGCEALAALGFSCVEVGTVTARPQPGNPRPRLFRLPRQRALINRMGFNNHGASAVAARLAQRRSIPVGVNIGKSKVVPDSGAISDYVESASRLARVADYVVVNVSSPNTPGLRDMQTEERLRPLLISVRSALDEANPRKVPLLVKIGPDLANADIDAIADLALELGLDGIVATNTTVSRDYLGSHAADPTRTEPGGLSGRPLKARAVQTLHRLRARVGNDMLLIGVGGIETAQDAWERIQAGATLIQAYTGFVYGGPFWPRRINRQLAATLRTQGFATIASAVGCRSGRKSTTC